MSEKQFDIFDEPFRKAAGHYEPEFSEDAWKKMEAKLDGGPDRRRPVGWLWWFSDLIMISLVLTLFIELRHPGTDSTAPGPVQQITKAKGKGNGAIENTNQKASLPTGLEKATEAFDTPNNNPYSENSNSDRGSVQQNVSNGNEKPGYQNGQVEKKDPSSSSSNPNDEVAIVEKQVASPGNEGLSAGHSVLAGEMIINSSNPVPETATENLLNTGIPANDHPETAGAITLTTLSPADSSLSPAPAEASPASGIVKQELKPFKGFYIQAGIAPEWSFIAGNKPGPITAAYGGAFGYAFGKRLSVQAGIFSTKKLYEAGPGDYDYYNLKVNHVEADCRVMEIPVTVNYLFLAKGKSRLFGTAGFASLIMNKEVYDIEFVGSNGAQQYRQKVYQTNAFNAFASMFLGAGYGFSINKNFAISAEPYMKIPMYGVGEGKVKINSAGIMFGLQYGISTRKKDKKTIAPPVQK